MKANVIKPGNSLPKTLQDYVLQSDPNSKIIGAQNGANGHQSKKID